MQRPTIQFPRRRTAPPRGTRPAIAPFFSLARGEWVAYSFVWDDSTGEFRGVDGPRGFASYREAVEASRFLIDAACLVAR